LQILAALAYARAGEPLRAGQLADKLQSRFPLDTALNRYWLPCIRSGVELNARDPVKAIEILKVASAYELGNPLPQAEMGAFLYPVYLRGQAYVQLRQGKEAEEEFRKFLDHRGITFNSVLGPLAYLGIARAYRLQGDSVKARAAYHDFLTIWKDADPDIPILKEAEVEYAKLQ
jgi:tetratricopeptide (TPR) repeat protein